MAHAQAMAPVDEAGRVRLRRCRAIYRVISELEAWQHVPYKFVREDTIKVGHGKRQWWWLGGRDGPS